MNIARTIARIVLGLGFIAAGIMGITIAPPPMPGLAGTLQTAFHDSHWMIFVSVAQIVLGAMLVAGRFVPLALVILCAFLYNSLAFHITTSPAAVPVPIIVLALGIFIGWPYRRLFGYVFGPNPGPVPSASIPNTKM